MTTLHEEGKHTITLLEAVKKGVLGPIMALRLFVFICVDCSHDLACFLVEQRVLGDAVGMALEMPLLGSMGAARPS